MRALAIETHENWLEQHRYLNMEDLHEHKKEIMRQAADRRGRYATLNRGALRTPGSSGPQLHDHFA